MKRFFHETKVAEYCEKMCWPGLKEAEPQDIPEGGKVKKPRTVAEAIPAWPEWDLPKDWRIAYKQLPTGPHKIYIPPNQDYGFLHHRSCVDRYLSEGKKLTLIAESKPMDEKMLITSENAKETYKGKRSSESVATALENYIDCGDTSSSTASSSGRWDRRQHANASQTVSAQAGRVPACVGQLDEQLSETEAHVQKHTIVSQAS